MRCSAAFAASSTCGLSICCRALLYGRRIISRILACLSARRYASTLWAMIPCLHAFVCLSLIGRLSKRLNGSRCILTWRLPLTYPTLCCKKIRISPTVRYFLRTMSHTLDVKKLRQCTYNHKCCQLSATDICCQFITPSINFCIQHDGQKGRNRCWPWAGFSSLCTCHVCHKDCHTWQLNLP